MFECSQGPKDNPSVLSDLHQDACLQLHLRPGPFLGMSPMWRYRDYAQAQVLLRGLLSSVCGMWS